MTYFRAFLDAKPTLSFARVGAPSSNLFPPGRPRRRLIHIRFLPQLAAAVSVALVVSPSSHGSVVRDTSSPESAPRYIASATREIANGDYVHTTSPSCGRVPGLGGGSEIWDAVAAWAESWAPPPGNPMYAGPLLRPDSINLVAPPAGVAIEGDLGRLLSKALAPRSACAVLAVAVPEGFIVEQITYEAAENSEVDDRAWHGCSLGSDCLQGWSRFEEARVYSSVSGTLIIASIFKNWAHNRARRARMNVSFTAPAGWTPRLRPSARSTVEFPSAHVLETLSEAKEDFQKLLRQSPPFEVTIAGGEPWSAQLSRIFGFTRRTLSVVTVPIRTETYFLNKRLRGLSGDDVDKIIEYGGKLLLPAIPSYATGTSAQTNVQITPDVWFAAERPGTPLAVDGPRWIPSTFIGASAAIVRTPVPGASRRSDPRLLLIEHDDFFLQDVDRAKTARSAISVLSGQMTIVAGASSSMESLSSTGLFPLPAGLSSALSKAQGSSTLYVVDTGWPTKEERQKALDWLARAGARGMKAIPERCGFSPPSGEGERHAVLISEALRPLTTLDGGKRVTTIYLPLGTMQCGASEFLREVVRLSLARRFKAVSGDASVLSESIMKTLPAASPKSLTFQSDRVVVDSYLDIFDQLHSGNRDKFFMNASWIVPETAGVPLNTPKEGFIVAAVGNFGREWNIFSSGYSFASLAMNAERVVAVTCQEPEANPGCTPSDTGLPKDQAGSSPLLVRSDGSVGSSCRTSFASPRVAWLLAAASAARGKDGLTWSEWVRRRIRTSLSPGTSNFSWSEFMTPFASTP